MISADLRPPAFREMRQLGTDEIYVLKRGKTMKELLSRLRFGCFEDPHGYYWIGPDAPDFPEHSRWFLVIERAALRQARSWSKVVFEEVAYGVPQVAENHQELPEDYGVLPPVNPLGLLQDLYIVINDAVAREHDRSIKVLSGGIDERYFELQDRALQTWHAFGYPGLAHNLVKLPWGEDTHELIRHYDRWQARHPEVAGLPYELALRMHGLGAYADWLIGEAPAGNWIESRAHCDLA
jgi:hypothetical protein